MADKEGNNYSDNQSVNPDFNRPVGNQNASPDQKNNSDYINKAFDDYKNGGKKHSPKQNDNRGSGKNSDPTNPSSQDSKKQDPSLAQKAKDSAKKHLKHQLGKKISNKLPGNMHISLDSPDYHDSEGGKGDDEITPARKIFDHERNKLAKKAAKSAFTKLKKTAVKQVLFRVLLVSALVALMMGSGSATSTLISNNVLNATNTTSACTTDDSSSASITNGDTQENAEAIWDYVKEKGGTSQGAAALLGNFTVETGGTLDPATIQGGQSYNEAKALLTSVSGYGFGLAQSDSGRRVKLIEYAKSKNASWSNLKTQLDEYFSNEGSDTTLIEGLVKKSGDISTITSEIMTEWERAGATSSVTTREADAKSWYEKLNGASLPADTSVDETSADVTDTSSDSGCSSATDTVDTDGTGTITSYGVWKPGNVPSDVKKYIHDPASAGLTYGSATGWADPGGECVHFSSSYFYAIWKSSSKMPSSVIKVPTGSVSAADWAKAMDGTVSKSPSAGAIASVPGNTAEGPSSAGHTFVVEHVLANGDIIIAEQNYAGYSGDEIGKPDTWDFRTITKAVYVKNGMTFFKPSGSPSWSK